MPGTIANIVCTIGISLVLQGCDSRSPSPPSKSNVSVPPEDLGNFWYKGHPVHPAVVEDFVAPLDGSPPKATIIDLDQKDYEARPKPDAVAHGFVKYSDLERHGEGGYFEYRHLGRTSAGTYVIETASSGGGSGIFMGLLFLRCRVEKSGPRLLLECFGEFCLGDRDDGTVRLDRDSVVISASRYRAQEVTLDLR